MNREKSQCSIVIYHCLILLQFTSLTWPTLYQNISDPFPSTSFGKGSATPDYQFTAAKKRVFAILFVQYRISLGHSSASTGAALTATWPGLVQRIKLTSLIYFLLLSSKGKFYTHTNTLRHRQTLLFTHIYYFRFVLKGEGL